MSKISISRGNFKVELINHAQGEPYVYIWEKVEGRPELELACGFPKGDLGDLIKLLVELNEV